MISSWDRGTKYKAMQDILASKFSINQDCADVLLGTKNDYLVEGNWWHDNTWGVCSCSKCDHGQNALGVLLMYTRLKLQVKENNA